MGSCRADLEVGTCRAQARLYGSAAHLPPPHFSRQQVRTSVIFIQFYSQAGLLQDLPVAVFNDGAIIDRCTEVLLRDAWGELERAEVAHGGRNVRGGNGANRAGSIVPANGKVVHRRQIRDSLGFQQPSSLGNVDLNLVNALVEDEGSKTFSQSGRAHV